MRFLSLPSENYSFFSVSFTGSSFMPHFGHLPGLFFTTSGCIGQVYFWAGALAEAPGAGDGVDSANAAEAKLNIAAQTRMVSIFMSYSFFFCCWFKQARNCVGLPG